MAEGPDSATGNIVGGSPPILFLSLLWAGVALGVYGVIALAVAAVRAIGKHKHLEH